MTLYDLIKRVSDIITPETGSFYSYVLYTSDDNGGFLRTRFCWWDDKPVENFELGDGCKKVLVTAKWPITEADLTDRSDVDRVGGIISTKAKVQFTYSKKENTLDDAEWDAQLGYRYAYIFDLEKGTYTMNELETLC